MIYPFKIEIPASDAFEDRHAFASMYACAVATKRPLRPLGLIMEGQRVYALTFQEALKLSLHNAVIDYGTRRERAAVLSPHLARGQLGRMLKLETRVDPEEVFRLLSVLGCGNVTIRAT